MILSFPSKVVSMAAKTSGGASQQTKKHQRQKRAPVAKTKMPETIGSAEMAKCLSITARRLNQLVSEGIIKKEGRGRFPVSANIQAFIEFKLQSEVSKLAPSSADNLAKRKEQALVRKMAREDRDLITMDETLEALEEATGQFLTSLSTLPSQITRDLEERQRIEKICDAERSRLSRSFVEITDTLQKGSGASQAATEDDAG